MSNTNHTPVHRGPAVHRNAAVRRRAPIRRNSPAHSLFRGIAGALVVIGIATGAAAAPMADPGPVAPVARLFNLQVMRTGRAAYITAMGMDGWELTTPVNVDNFGAPPTAPLPR
jgi:hypothetical protein